MPLVWGIKPKGNTIKPNADHIKISAVANNTIISNKPKNNNSPKTTRKNMMSLGIMVSKPIKHANTIKSIIPQINYHCIRT
ncbi:hypothetical protein BTM119_12290 [Helicobacter pylori]